MSKDFTTRGFKVLPRITLGIRDVSWETKWGKIRPDSYPVTALVPEKHMLKNGFPFTPKLWSQNSSLVSVDGTYLKSDRPAPGSLEIETHSRFIASADTWDYQSGQWFPQHSDGVSYSFVSPPGMAPELVTRTYRVEKELLSPPCLIFSKGDYLRSSFNNSNDSSMSFTAYMVCAPLSAERGTLISFSNGVEINYEDRIYVTDAGNRTSSISVSPMSMCPMYLVISVDLPNMTVYISEGLNDIKSVTMNAGDNSWMLDFFIGKNPMQGNYSPLAVMEFGLLNHPAAQRLPGVKRLNVSSLISKLAYAYGAN